MSDDQIADDTTEEEIPFRYAITSYGADYPLDGVVRRLQDNSIFIPEFQREYVWKPNRAMEFMESLLLGLPVPGIFLARDPLTEKLMVIDGQQRLKSIRYFFEGAFPDGPTFSIKIRDSPYEGKTYDSLEENDRTRLNDYVIHATIVRQDKPEDNQNSIYLLFERLNTGAVILQPQEIRVALYHGKLMNLLGQLNLNASWRTIFGEKNPRRRDEELILRFFALYFMGEAYEAPMKGFLNKYANLNRNLALQSEAQLRELFNSTCELALRSIGPLAFRPIRALNAASFDSIMVGLALRLARGPVENLGNIKSQYESVTKDTQFREAIETSTSDPEKVATRIRLAIAAFSDVT